MITLTETDNGTKTKLQVDMKKLHENITAESRREIEKVWTKIYREAIKNCIPVDTPILVNNSIINSQDVTKDHKIYGKDNNYQSIKKVFKRDYNGYLYSIKATGIPEFSVTPEHPLFISRMVINGKPRLYTYSNPEFKFSSSLESQKQSINRNNIDCDCLVFPKYKIYNDIDELDLTKYLTVGDGNFNKERIMSRVRFDKFPLNKKTMGLLGLFLAKGCATESGAICWTYHKKETALIEFTKAALEELGLHVHLRTQNNVTYVVTYCIQFALLLRDEIGTTSLNKKIPMFVMNTSNENVREFIIYAFKGDGSKYISKKNSIVMEYSTSSISVAYQMQKLLSKLNVFSHLCHSKRNKPHTIEGRQVNYNTGYHLTLSTKWIERLGLETVKINHKYSEQIGEDDKYFYLPIQKINKKEYNGIVYNYMTEDSTYQVSNIISHNCPVDTGTLVSSIKLVTGYTPDMGSEKIESTFGGQGKAVSLFNGMITAGDNSVNPKTKKQSIEYACFTKNNTVISDNKIINVFDLKEGNLVYSNGCYEQVTGIKERIYSGTFYRIYRHKSSFPLEVTSEHKVFAIRGKICPHHKGYNYICRPSCKYHNRKKPVYLSCKEYEKYNVELVEAKDLKVGDWLISPRLDTIIDSTISPELCRLIGYFCAEGDIDKEYYVRFTFNGNEIDTFVKDVDNLMFKEFGEHTSKPQIKEDSEGGSYTICYCSKDAVKFFKQFYNSNEKFGNCGKKYLPEWCMYLPIEKQKEIICGLYRGDGLKAKNKKRLEIVSPILAAQTVIILERMGFSPSFRIEKVLPCHDCYIVEVTGNELLEFDKMTNDGVEPKIGNMNREYCLKTNDFIAYPISKIESWKDELEVRDIEVENTHSLVVNGVLVKNSLVHDGHKSPSGKWIEGSFFLSKAIDANEARLYEAINKAIEKASNK